MTSNPRIVFAKHPGPHEAPKIGEHLVHDNSPTIDLEHVPLNGGYLTKTLILRYVDLTVENVVFALTCGWGHSPEPAIRERMREPSITSYTTTFTIGGPYVIFYNIYCIII